MLFRSIVRPTNNYGIGQYVEKLIPKTVKYLELGRLIDLHNHGEPRRTWLHADDTAQAVLTIVNSGSVNEIYNISGNFETANREVIQKILSIQIGSNAADRWQQYVMDSERQGQDVRYSIDDAKLKSLGWLPRADFDTELEKVVKYYRETFVW